ncbi:19848_t:CDS:1, partial [Gigaspora margarita]
SNVDSGLDVSVKSIKVVLVGLDKVVLEGIVVVDELVVDFSDSGKFLDRFGNSKSGLVVGL